MAAAESQDAGGDVARRHDGHGDRTELFLQHRPDGGEFVRSRGRHAGAAPGAAQGQHGVAQASVGADPVDVGNIGHQRSKTHCGGFGLGRESVGQRCLGHKAMGAQDVGQGHVVDPLPPLRPEELFRTQRASRHERPTEIPRADMPLRVRNLSNLVEDLNAHR